MKGARQALWLALVVSHLSGVSSWSNSRLPTRRMGSLVVPGASTLPTSPTPDIDASVEQRGQQLLSDFTEDMAALRAIRPSDPAQDPSAPTHKISLGSTYARIWTQETWDSHDRPPLQRYWKHIRCWHTSSTARRIIPVVLLTGLHAGIVSFLGNRNPAAFLCDIHAHKHTITRMLPTSQAFLPNH